MSDKIDKALDILIDGQVEEDKLPTFVQKDQGRDDDVQEDYKKRREVLYDLIEKGSEALESSLKVAKGSQHPRNFEVTGQLIKTMADVTKELTDLQQSMDKLEGVEKEGKSGSVTNNAIFVGSTDELMRALNGDNEMKVIDG